MLYNAELALAFDQDAAESLVSMFCDAHFWLSSDAETVASGDHRFTGRLGRNMTVEVIQLSFSTAPKIGYVSRRSSLRHPSTTCLPQ